MQSGIERRVRSARFILSESEFIQESPRLHARTQMYWWRAAEVTRSKERIDRMNKDEIKGKAKQVKGAVKETYGRLANDPATRASGKLDKVEGKAQEALGEAKETIKAAANKVMDRAEGRR